MKGEKIHSVLISGPRWGFIVLGAFYLDVAAAGVCFSLLFHSLSLSLPSSFSSFMCVCNQDKCVYSFVYILFFYYLNSHRHILPSAFQERCNFFLMILMLLVLPSLFLSVLFCLFLCNCAAVHKKAVVVSFSFFLN